MTIEFIITDNTVELLSNTDTGDNTLIVNGDIIPESSWVGSGYYTVDGISIKKIADTSGNIFCNKISATEYELNRETPTTGGGHIILNENGSAMPQRSKLQFENCTVTDDSTNDKTVVTANEGTSFVLANRTLTFSNLVATVSDARITASTYATVYFHDGCLSAAVNAGLKVDTSAGAVTITATTAPSSTLTCDIVCENGTGGGSISSLIAELRDDVDAIDTLMGATSISTIGDGTVTGAISTINNDLSALITTGQFRVATTANSTISVTSSSVIDGTLPTKPNQCVFNIIGHSQGTASTDTVFCEGGGIRVRSINISQTLTIKWYQFSS